MVLIKDNEILGSKDKIIKDNGNETIKQMNDLMRKAGEFHSLYTYFLEESLYALEDFFEDFEKEFPNLSACPEVYNLEGGFSISSKKSLDNEEIEELEEFFNSKYDSQSFSSDYYGSEYTYYFRYHGELFDKIFSQYSVELDDFLNNKYIHNNEDFKYNGQFLIKNNEVIGFKNGELIRDNGKEQIKKINKIMTKAGEFFSLYLNYLNKASCLFESIEEELKDKFPMVARIVTDFYDLEGRFDLVARKKLTDDELEEIGKFLNSKYASVGSSGFNSYNFIYHDSIFYYLFDYFAFEFYDFLRDKYGLSDWDHYTLHYTNHILDEL